MLHNLYSYQKSSTGKSWGDSKLDPSELAGMKCHVVRAQKSSRWSHFRILHVATTNHKMAPHPG